MIYCFILFYYTVIKITKHSNHMSFFSSISSSENKEIKILKHILQNPKKNDPFVIVEGLKQVFEFGKSSYYKLIRWFVDEEIDEREFLYFADQFVECPIFRVKASLFSSCSDVYSSQGVIGLFERVYSFKDYSRFAVHQPTFILDNLQDPGNMGTLIRTAVAFGRTQIVLVGGVYPESSKVIRSSAGLIAKIKIFSMTLDDIQKYILSAGGNCIGTAAHGKYVQDFSIDLLSHSFLILGNEGQGMSKEWGAFSLKYVSLPMAVGVESLNVSVVGGVLSYLCWGSSI